MRDTLFVSNRDFDYHSLIKVAELNRHLGQIRVFDADGGYLVVFTDCLESAKELFEKRLRDLTRNIWSY